MTKYATVTSYIEAEQWLGDNFSKVQALASDSIGMIKYIADGNMLQVCTEKECLFVYLGEYLLKLDTGVFAVWDEESFNRKYVQIS